MKEGRAWEGFKLKFAQPQETQPVPLGTNLAGFDLIQVPDQQAIGKIVNLNLLIISTNTEHQI